MKNRNLKIAVQTIDASTPELNNNAFMIELWRKMGLQDRMGGLAFSELKHFLRNSPDVDTITRYRREKR